MTLKSLQIGKHSSVKMAAYAQECNQRCNAESNSEATFQTYLPLKLKKGEDVMSN